MRALLTNQDKRACAHQSGADRQCVCGVTAEDGVCVCCQTISGDRRQARNNTVFHVHALNVHAAVRARRRYREGGGARMLNLGRVRFECDTVCDREGRQCSHARDRGGPGAHAGQMTLASFGISSNEFLQFFLP